MALNTAFRFVSSHATIGRRYVAGPVARRSFGSTSATSMISETEVTGLFSVWNNALATLDSDKVAQCYSKDAVLLPSAKDSPRTDTAAIKDHYDDFLLKKPQCEILKSWIKIGKCGLWAQDNGIYEFTMGKTGDVMKARYSFVYVLEDDDDGWKIVHHHSSLMPEGLLSAIQRLHQVESILSLDFPRNEN
ncbi:MAG: hypothetical protein ACI90V_011227 [Bacillariaceae sp.]|jgi:uncharacterized protein (TIGR02246 family)